MALTVPYICWSSCVLFMKPILIWVWSRKIKSAARRVLLPIEIFFFFVWQPKDRQGCRGWGCAGQQTLKLSGWNLHFLPQRRSTRSSWDRGLRAEAVRSGSALIEWRSEVSAEVLPFSASSGWRSIDRSVDRSISSSGISRARHAAGQQSEQSKLSRQSSY